DDGKDPFLSDGYLHAFERLGTPGMNALLSLADSGNARDRDRVALAFTGLRSREAATALNSFINNQHLLPGQRADLIRAYANFQFDPPLPMEHLAINVQKDPNETLAVKIATIETLSATGHLKLPSATVLTLRMLGDTNPDARQAAIQAIDESRLTAALPTMLPMLSDEKRSKEERTALLKAIRVTGNSSTAAVLTKLLQGNEPAKFRAEVLRTIAALDATAARTAAVGLLDQSDPTLLQEAVATLSVTKDGAKLVGERYLAKKLPRDMWPMVSEALRKFSTDPIITKLNLDVMKGGLTVTNSPADRERIRTLVAKQGDPRKGKEVYLNSAALACVTCHKMEGVGGQVGPDLTRVWDTHTLDKIMEAIIQPSAEIKEGYQSYRVSTTDGKSYVGLRIADSAKEVTIREANGRDVRILKEDIERMAASKVSLMPEDAIAQITFDQYIDLLAFLKSKAHQESLRGTINEVAVSEVYDGELKASHAPETGSASVWQRLSTDFGGTLRLPEHAAKKPGVQYLRFSVYSTKKTDLRVDVSSASPFTIIANRVVAQGTTLGNVYQLPIEAGWTKVLVKLERTAATAANVRLRVVTENVQVAVEPPTK
ncbi:MAG: hypothetical protein ACRCZF_05940, partial [Gemmataceae bacterium]